MANSATISGLGLKSHAKFTSPCYHEYIRLRLSSVLYEVPMINAARYIILFDNFRNALWMCNLNLCPVLAIRIVDGKAIDQDLLWYRLHLNYLKYLSTNENAYGEEITITSTVSKVVEVSIEES